MEQIIERVAQWTGANTWVVQVFVVVFFAMLADLVKRRLVRQLHRRFQNTRNPWDDDVLMAATRPLTLLIWVVGITFAADIVRHETEAAIFNAIDPIRRVGVIVAVAWFLVRLTARLQQTVIQRGLESGEPYDRTTADAIAKLVRLSVIITAALVILQTLGYSVSGVLAFGGIGGIAVGFAAKDLLANFFGGLMIYLDRPFQIGDWIRSPDREIEGTVESIGWRLTTIRSFSKRPIYVPNSMFANISVENPSRMTHRRIYETIGLRYDDAAKVGDILKDIETLLRQHPEIDDSQTLMVNFNTFAPSSLDFFIYTFTHTTNWVKYHAIKQEILLGIERIIRQHGAEIAFPTSTVHLPDGIRLETLPDAGKVS
ncbi:MAG TPA: mechanosensitive ion channel family protein [Gammaproteobacteria bacterium]|nr:mechanosensitive ion channel family protein [Gammaproteobacteria bacterium]